jgi:hypothetical protein
MGDSANRRGGRTRRDGAHAPGRPRGGKVKRTICLSVEASTRLDVHAVGLGLDVSAIVEQLVDRHLRRFVLQDRGGPGIGAGEGGLPPASGDHPE